MDARAANALRIFAFFIDIALLFEALSFANRQAISAPLKGSTVLPAVCFQLYTGYLSASRRFSKLRFTASSVARTTLCISCITQQAEPERMRFSSETH